MSYLLRIPQIKLLLKHWNPPNILPYRDTLYIEYRDGSTLSLSLLSKLAQAVDDYLNNKVTEIVVESDYIDLKTDITTLKTLGSGLVAEYLFYEGSGGTLHDSSGNGNDATIYGATWKQLNGKWCLSFDGVDDKVVTPINPAGWNKLTLEVVFKLTNYDETNPQRPASAYGIFDVSIPKYNDQLWVGIYAQEDEKLYYISLGVTPTDILNKWTRVVMSFGGTFLKGYLNGVLKGTINISFDAHLRIPAVTHYVQFGAENGLFPFAGDIAISRIFNRVLSDTEHKLLYKLAKIAVPDLP